MTYEDWFIKSLEGYSILINGLYRKINLQDCIIWGTDYNTYLAVGYYEGDKHIMTDFDIELEINLLKTT